MPIKKFKIGEVVGILSEPKEKTENLVIICHGFTAGKDELIDKKVFNYFRKNNFSVFRFDFYAHGETRGSFSDLTFTREISDLRQVYKFFSKRYKRIFAVGHSLGGAVIAYSRLKFSAAALLAPSMLVKNIFSWLIDYYNAREEFEKTGKFYLPREWGYDWSNTFTRFTVTKKLVNDLKKYHGKLLSKVNYPTIVFYGSKEVPAARKFGRQAFKLLISKKKFVMVKGADHQFNGKEDFVNKWAHRWFEKSK